MKLNTLIKRGVQVLIEKGVTETSARQSASSLAAHLHVQADWAGTGEKFVDEAVETTFLADLLKPYLHRSSWTDGEDEVISFEAPPPNPIDQLNELGRKVQADQDAAARQGSILGGTAAPPTAASYAAPASAPVRTVAPATIVPNSTPGTVLKSAAAGGLSIVRKLQIDAEVARDLSVAVSKALATPVAKAASHSARIIKAVP